MGRHVLWVGFIILMGGILAALWKIGHPRKHRHYVDRDRRRHPDRPWEMMFSVANSGVKENIQIDRK